MEEIKLIFDGILISRMNNIYQYLKGLAPRAFDAILILLIGWLLAVLIKKITSKLLRAVGVDVISEKTGIKAFFAKGGVSANLSFIIGSFLYWILIASAFMMAFNALEMQAAYGFVRKLILYVPKAAIGLLLVVLGAYIGRISENFISTAARLAAMPFYRLLGRISRYAIMGIAIMMALEQLDVAAPIISHSFILLFGLIPIALIVVLAISGKDLISGIISRGFLQRTYRIGDKISLGHVSGEITEIDFVSTTIRSQDKEIIIPNTDLIKNTTQRSRVK
jgi:small-conductance mechanosensitive channel